MQSVLRIHPRPMLAALVLTAAAAPLLAVFQAPSPGADLAPTDDAGRIVEILQGNRGVLWTSLIGPIAYVETRGWPVTIDGNDLGGALVIEQVDGATAGVVDIGEKPMSLGFGS
jgi:hypothetical protein